MSNPLTIILPVILVIIAIIFLLCTGPGANSKTERKRTIMLFVGVAVVSAAIYGYRGHFNDWQEQKLDDTKDFQLAAKITEARRAVIAKPKNIELKKELANLYMEAGLFDQAADALQEVIDIKGEDSAVLGMKARAAYYRDGRKMNAEVEDLLDKAIALNKNEVQSRMLIAEDAFRNGNYQKAIDQWQLLLDAGVAPDKERAFKNAIRNAKERIGKSE